MNPTDYYDLPRVDRTPHGRTVDAITTACTALAGLFLLVGWVVEVWEAWSDHGFVPAALLTIAITVAVAIIAAIAFAVSLTGKFGVVLLVTVAVLMAWWWPSTAMVLACVVPIALMTVAAVASSWRRDGQAYTPIEPKLLEQRIIGEPAGHLGDAVEKFGAANVTKGIAGEQLTNDEFAAHLDDHPGVQLVNGLRFPGSDKADVDHALVCGNRIALLDSKYWTGNSYRWGGPGLVLSGRGHDLTSHETNFGVAVDRLSSTFTADNKEVRGWTVLHSNNGRPMECPAPASTAELPTLIAGTDWLPAVMAWLTSEQPGADTDTMRARQCDTMKLVLDWMK
ncbi:nuclease-related domain-containing protein [Gordonia sp. VNK1]|uniref:nuclease-related domain-containing protein n=1 Tax=Gordonia oleivorans TaxID=3156618 RepID=UPI0032B346AF